MIYFHVDDGAEQKQLAVPLSPPVCGLWGVPTPLLSPFISLLKPLSEAWLRGGGGSALMGQLLLGVDVPSESFLGGKADVVSAWEPGYGVSHPESTFTLLI